MKKVIFVFLMVVFPIVLFANSLYKVDSNGACLLSTSQAGHPHNQGKPIGPLKKGKPQHYSKVPTIPGLHFLVFRVDAEVNKVPKTELPLKWERGDSFATLTATAGIDILLPSPFDFSKAGSSSRWIILIPFHESDGKGSVKDHIIAANSHIAVLTGDPKANFIVIDTQDPQYAHLGADYHIVAHVIDKNGGKPLDFDVIANYSPLEHQKQFVQMNWLSETQFGNIFYNYQKKERRSLWLYNLDLAQEALLSWQKINYASNGLSLFHALSLVLASDFQKNLEPFFQSDNGSSLYQRLRGSVNLLVQNISFQNISGKVNLNYLAATKAEKLTSKEIILAAHVLKDLSLDEFDKVLSDAYFDHQDFTVTLLKITTFSAKLFSLDSGTPLYQKVVSRLKQNVEYLISNYSTNKQTKEQVGSFVFDYLVNPVFRHIKFDGTLVESKLLEILSFDFLREALVLRAQEDVNMLPKKLTLGDVVDVLMPPRLIKPEIPESQNHWRTSLEKAYLIVEASLKFSKEESLVLRRPGQSLQTLLLNYRNYWRQQKFYSQAYEHLATTSLQAFLKGVQPHTNPDSFLLRIYYGRYFNSTSEMVRAFNLKRDFIVQFPTIGDLFTSQTTLPTLISIHEKP